MRSFAVAMLALCVLTGGALAQTETPPPAPPADAAAAPQPDKQLICTDQNPAASTRVHSQRVCRTREEWEKRGGVPK